MDKSEFPQDLFSFSDSENKSLNHLEKSNDVGVNST